MKSRRITLAVAVTLAVSFVGGTWLLAQPRVGVGAFGPIAASPAYIVVNTATSVVFTVQITDPQLKKRSVVLVRLDASGQPSDILGRLRDDGRNGDAIAGDSIYSARQSLNEAIVGTVSFKIAARFKPGRWSEPEADDDDWDAELATTPSAGRDRPDERTKREKRLKKLARSTLSNPVSLNVWQAVPATSVGVDVAVPPHWTIERGAAGDIEAMLAPGKVASEDNEYSGDILFFIDGNPSGVDPATFYASNGPNLFSDAEQIDTLSQGGLNGWRFHTVRGMIAGDVVVFSLPNGFLRIENRGQGAVFDSVVATIVARR